MEGTHVGLVDCIEVISYLNDTIEIFLVTFVSCVEVDVSLLIKPCTHHNSELGSKFLCINIGKKNEIELELKLK